MFGRSPLLCALVTAIAVVGAAAPGHAAPKARKHKHRSSSGGGGHAKGRFESPADATTMPAVRYGSMSSADCLAELTARQIPFVSETARGVATPVRLTGPLHGVTITAQVEAKDQATTLHAIADCSLILALDDLTAILARHDVVELTHYSMYRAPEPSWPEDKVATRHAGAVAIDAAHFKKSDGTQLTVLDDFHGKIGAKTCGDGAGPHPSTPAAVELRAILCEAVAAHLFNVVLTPDFNRPHRNHFHLEVTAGVRWFLVH